MANYPRALVLPDDPTWLHEGKTFRLQMRGADVDLFAVGVLARALHRSVGSIRRMETQGVIPPPVARFPGRNRCGQPRLYSRHEILCIVSWFERERLLDRRPQCWRERLARTA